MWVYFEPWGCKRPYEGDSYPKGPRTQIMGFYGFRFKGSGSKDPTNYIVGF